MTREGHEHLVSDAPDSFSAQPVPAGLADGNISFDPQGNPISVNSSFIEVCGRPGNPPSPCRGGGMSYACALGNQRLSTST
jgi:hypothetical protein